MGGGLFVQRMNISCVLCIHVFQIKLINSKIERQHHELWASYSVNAEITFSASVKQFSPSCVLFTNTLIDAIELLTKYNFAKFVLLYWPI